MADTEQFCPWMLKQDCVEFKRPFAAIVGKYVLEAPSIWQATERTIGTVAILNLKYGLRISMLVEPATTRIHLSHRLGGVWFDMRLDTKSRTDFIGWLSMVKMAIEEVPPEMCNIANTLDAVQVRMTGTVRFPVVAD